MSDVPGEQALITGLNNLSDGEGIGSPVVAILKRRSNPYATNFTSEIVSCTRADGRTMHLFCKYGESRIATDYGHCGGLAYEGSAYRDILRAAGFSPLRYYGTHTNTDTGLTWLFLEYIEDGVYLHKAPLPNRLPVAAEWIGRFHAAHERRCEDMDSVNVYDLEYYLRWVDRAAGFAVGLIDEFPWFGSVCDAYAALVMSLVESPVTVIHGDFYTDNILFKGERIYPIDWELTAIAAGEIDVVSLVAAWPIAVVTECQQAYERARWSAGAPYDLTRSFDIARLYLHMRWLGERQELTLEERSRWRFDALHEAAGRLQLL